MNHEVREKMTIDSENILNSILSSLERIDYIKPTEIPNIDLYMDQVTTFMEEHLQSSKRYPDDKILTKTMINNYAKNHLLPAPDKKKYSKEHLLLLIYIYYYKSILSIGDIQSLLEPLTQRYFHKDGEMNMQSIYEEVFSLEKSQVEKMKQDVIDKLIPERFRQSQLIRRAVDQIPARVLIVNKLTGIRSADLRELRYQLIGIRSIAQRNRS